jgi:hypothetical protein
MAELSILEPYTSQLQVVVDNALGLFAPTWFEKYFTIDSKQATLDYETVIGRQRIEAAATVASRDGETPLRARPGLEKLKGEIPVLKEMFTMSEKDFRNWEILKALTTNDAAKKDAMLKLLFDDLTKAGNSVMKRMDIFCLQGISTGQISLDVAINPDGVVWVDPIDLLAPDANFFDSAVSWADNVNADPFEDILTVVTAATASGKYFSKMLISQNIWMKLMRSQKLISLIAAFSGQRDITNMRPTLKNVNDYLTEQAWPVFEVVEQIIGIEKDGKVGTIKPFNQNNVAFVPAGILGTIKQAIAIEEIRKVEKVAYADFKGALLSKWAQNEPFREYTKVEWNAFPSFDAIDNIYYLTAIHA